ncbi:MAG: hypothetical protein GY854_33770 [Deltaproteobacteria bacterium]|nr:hypothetical protein [Deltaproteobacteria bacterium]
MEQRYKRIGVCGAVCAALLVFVSAAKAEDAKQAYRRGVAAFNEAKYGEAAEAFSEAYRLKPSWKILYNVGQSNAATARYGLALEAFEAYLVEGADQVSGDRREAVITELQRLRVLVGVVEVRGADSGVELTIDGVSRGVTPFEGPIRVAAGKHDAVLKQDEEIVLAQQITVAGGMTTKLEIEKKEEPPPPAPVPVPEEKAQEPEALEEAPPEEAASVEEETTPDPVNEESSGISPVPFWVALGTTGALGIGTVILELAVQGKASSLDDDPTNSKAYDKGKELQTGERVLLGLTGAAAVTTVVLLFFTDFKREKAESSDSAKNHYVMPLITEDAVGVGISGRF